MKEILMISFEGLDGAGKTTHTQRLKELLEEDGLEVLLISSPSRSFVGRAIRANLVELDGDRKDRLFAYDIRRSSRQIEGRFDLIIWDRHIDSIYTSNIHTRYTDLKRLSQGIIWPTKAILLDITPETSMIREGETTDHPLDIEWLNMKYDRYRELVGNEPERFIVVDAERSMEEVFREVLGEAHKLLREDSK